MAANGTGERHEIRYTGSPAFAGFLVSNLEQEGVKVEWDPPEERRGVEEAAQAFIISIAAAGSYDVIKAVVRRFLQRFPRAEVEIDPGDDAEA